MSVVIRTVCLEEFHGGRRRRTEPIYLPCHYSVFWREEASRAKVFHWCVFWDSCPLVLPRTYMWSFFVVVFFGESAFALHGVRVCGLCHRVRAAGTSCFRSSSGQNLNPPFCLCVFSGTVCY